MLKVLIFGMKRVHFGVFIVLTGTLLILSSHGLGRFAYAMILPPMREGLALDYGEAGLLATGNFTGYLVFSLIAGLVSARLGLRRVALLGLALVGSSMVLTGFADGFVTALLGRTATGVGSAVVNIGAMGLAAAWFAPARRGLATGIMVGGSGIGVALSGVVVPAIVVAYGDEGWRYAWYYLGATVLAITVLASITLRESPSRMGLRPVGAAGDDPPPTPVTRDDLRRMYASPDLWRCGLVYLAFGVSYVISATFFAAYLTAEVGLSVVEAGRLWATAGFISIFSPAVFGLLSDHIGRPRGLALAFLLLGFSLALFASSQSITTVQIATLMFGLASWPIPALALATTGDIVGARLAPAGIGFVTVLFGIGQSVGPALGGYLADSTGSFALALGISALAAFTGAAGSITLRRSPGLSSSTAGVPEPHDRSGT